MNLFFVFGTGGCASAVDRIWILRGRQTDAADPQMIGAETRFLTTEPHEARNQHGRAGQQDDRKTHLRRNQSAAKALLTATAGNSAPAIFQAVDEIGSRTLPRWIHSYRQTGQERKH